MGIIDKIGMVHFNFLAAREGAGSLRAAVSCYGGADWQNSKQ
jgi:hypothetical protein